MIKPTKKGLGLIERLKTATKRRSYKSWIDLLPKQTAEKIIQVKTMLKSGELTVSAAHAADEIIDEFGADELGVKRDTIRRYLTGNG